MQIETIPLSFGHIGTFELTLEQDEEILDIFTTKNQIASANSINYSSKASLLVKKKTDSGAKSVAANTIRLMFIDLSYGNIEIDFNKWEFWKTISLQAYSLKIDDHSPLGVSQGFSLPPRYNHMAWIQGKNYDTNYAIFIEKNNKTAVKSLKKNSRLNFND